MNNEIIERLKKREADIHSKLTAELLKKRRRIERDNAREFAAVGEALCKYATARNPEFKLMLKQVLPMAAAELRESDRAFLAGRGWF